MEILWQQSEDRAGYQHAYQDSALGSVCGAKARQTERASLVEPTAGRACPKCLDTLLENLTLEEVKRLPLSAFNAVSTSPRAMRAIQTLKQNAKTIGDLEGFTIWDFEGVKSCGTKTIEMIHFWMVRSRLALRGSSQARHGFTEEEWGKELKRRTEARTKVGLEKRKRAHEEQANRFIHAVGADGIKNLTLEQIGSQLGISRERVRQIFSVNPLLSFLRDGGRLGRTKEKLRKTADLLLQGEVPSAALRQTGLDHATLSRYASRDAAFAALVKAGKQAKKAKLKEKRRARLQAVVDYAKEHGLSMRGACVALGIKYGSFASYKNRKCSDLKDDPDFREILNPGALIREAVAVARERIVAGLSVWKACKGLGTTEATIRRHLADDPEVGPLIREKAKSFTQNEDLALALVRAKAFLLEGKSVSKAAEMAGIDRRTVGRHLAEDPDVKSILEGRKRKPREVEFPDEHGENDGTTGGTAN